MAQLEDLHDEFLMFNNSIVQKQINESQMVNNT